MKYVGEMVEKIPSLTADRKNEEVDKIFHENTSLHGIVVVDKEDRPIAIVTRTNFYQEIGTLYGYHLYMGREIHLIAKRNILIVDYYQSITDVSTLAMGRSAEDLYDEIIVTKNDKYIGTISIQRLLLQLVDAQVELASYLNPLTRLPGNVLIDEKLREIINEKQYSILYFDLDYFKAYNDTYGFKKGDNVLTYFAEVLKQHLSDNDFFLGHIGGDDFIAICPHYQIHDVCEAIIETFDQGIKKFYPPSDQSRTYFIVEDRSGKTAKVSFVSLSIAVITNRNQKIRNIDVLTEQVAAIKRKCKQQLGSCYIVQ